MDDTTTDYIDINRTIYLGQTKVWIGYLGLTSDDFPTFVSLVRPQDTTQWYLDNVTLVFGPPGLPLGSGELPSSGEPSSGEPSSTKGSPCEVGTLYR